ncbi:cytochrome P450 2G1-like, partial [Lagopus leucura]|uniref:cytochrome P450 2G1-like n=1 Tax=Lagopus leucura TaxID=30410 RepID=UPI001C6851B3
MEAMLLLLLLLSLLLLLAVRGWRGAGGGRLPPGPTPLPLIGNLLQISPSQTLQSFLKLRDRYGPVFTVYLGTRRVVVLCGHQAVHEALVERAEEFAGRGRLPSLERTFRGHGEGRGALGGRRPGVGSVTPLWGRPVVGHRAPAPPTSNLTPHSDPRPRNPLPVPPPRCHRQTVTPP